MTTTGHIFRADVAKRLGITTQMVDLLEKNGRIKGERKDGRVRFDAASIEAFAAVYNPPTANGVRKANHRSATRSADPKIRGDLAAQIFAYFKRGVVNVGEIVEATKAPPHLVRAMWAEYSTPLGQVDPAKVAAEKKRDEREKQRQADRREVHRSRVRAALIQSGALPADVVRKMAKEFEP